MVSTYLKEMLVKLGTMSDSFGVKNIFIQKKNEIFWNTTNLNPPAKQYLYNVYTQRTYIIIYTCHIWQLPTNLGMTTPHNHNQGVSRRHRSRARRSSKPIRSNHSWRSCAYETARWSGGVCSFIIHVAGESRKYMYMIYSTCVCVYMDVYVYAHLSYSIYVVHMCSLYVYVYIYITYSKIWPRFQHYDTPKAKGA